jgi:hypothetical protein
LTLKHKQNFDTVMMTWLSAYITIICSPNQV